MTKAFKLNWHIPVPEELQRGTVADRWTEVRTTTLTALTTTKTTTVKYQNRPTMTRWLKAASP